MCRKARLGIVTNGILLHSQVCLISHYRGAFHRR